MFVIYLFEKLGLLKNESFTGLRVDRFVKNESISSVSVNFTLKVFRKLNVFQPAQINFADFHPNKEIYCPRYLTCELGHFSAPK